MGEFKRSSRFGIVGVFAVGAFTAVVGLTLGNGSDPTLAMALILGVVFAFMPRCSRCSGTRSTRRKRGRKAPQRPDPALDARPVARRHLADAAS